MDSNRSLWNRQQQELRKALSRPGDHPRAVELFLRQHAMVHAAAMSGSGLWSFEDEVREGLSDEAARRLPPKFEHSIVWLFWHLARCEDITMNMLAAGSPQLLEQGGWYARMKVQARDTGNAMNAAEMVSFSAAIDIPALHAYRQAVGWRTRQVVQGLQAEDLKRKVAPARLQQVLAEGAVLESEQWLIDYWGGLTVAGLLLMPPTRHNLVHLNEALRIKQKCARS